MINQQLPESNASLAGYAVLIETYGLNVPGPLKLSAISLKHKKYETDQWRIFTPRHAPVNSLYGHLVFALKYEGIELGIIKELFDEIKSAEIETIVRSEPNGSYARRIWFLYEFLQEELLNIDDINQGNFVDLLDNRLQYAGPSRPSKRQRVRNNLPGVKAFCPLVRRTKKLDRYIEQDLHTQVLKNIDSVHPDILLRAAAFLLLEDSKASYAIEGETPQHTRAEHWGRVLGKAGQTELTHDEFKRLQREVIADTRFIHMGYRKEGGFIGTHDRLTGQPIPDHVSARFDDIDYLMSGLIETAKLLRGTDYPPVLAASTIAFGFVFIHPFEDGNGRVHRYLLHHVLSESGFTPKGVVFPVSSVILERISDYRIVLESYSKPRLNHIEWSATDEGNIKVLNNTSNLYRFFDATIQAEFFYDCIYETITDSLPKEVEYLYKYDLMKNFINSCIDMPDRIADLLIRFLSQNNGELSERARNKEFSELSDSEIQVFEDKFAEIFK